MVGSAAVTWSREYAETRTGIPPERSVDVVSNTDDPACSTTSRSSSRPGSDGVASAYRKSSAAPDADVGRSGRRGGCSGRTSIRLHPDVDEVGTPSTERLKSAAGRTQS